MAFYLDTNQITRPQIHRRHDSPVHDGYREIAESGSGQDRYYVHGALYINEHVQIYDSAIDYDHPFYYVQDRMYNVWGLIDRTGALMERYVYESYGYPYIRESAGRGDFDVDTIIDSPTDGARYNSVKAGSVWDPRGDLNDDGAVNSSDDSLFSAAVSFWKKNTAPTVAQAYSDVGNPFGWQDRVILLFNTDWNYQFNELPLIDHRFRMNDPVTGRWLNCDPIGYAGGSMNLYENVGSNALYWADPLGLFFGGRGPQARIQRTSKIARNATKNAKTMPIDYRFFPSVHQTDDHRNTNP